MEESNLREVRLEKLEKIKSLGWNPYPASFDKENTVSEVLKSEGITVKTAGRIFSFREHGNIIFADLKDETGKIQIFFQKKLLGENYKNLKLLDIGDFIGVEGEVVKTTAGEISIAPVSYVLLTKSLLPLSSEFFGLKDPETKLRRRYLDLILNPELREVFRKKNIFWQSIREYLVRNGGLEVETPVLVNTTGGADARPFITHHNAFDMDVYLRISPELYLKRLLVAGFEKVFEIGRIFRNEGISNEHLQDYTQMEMYWAYKDYAWLMDFVEKMTQEVIKKVFGTLKTEWKGHAIDWSGKWPRIEFIKLLSNKWDLDAEKLSVKQLYELSEKLKVKIEPNLGRGRVLDYLYKKTIRPDLIQPMFLINHPVDVEPLAKRLEVNPDNVQRMQILAMGSELGKGFSELNDPIDQYERFREQQSLRDAGDEEAQMMDEDFVEALEYGMPPAAGFGYSERLFALLMEKSVREMQFFPLMKPENHTGIEINRLKNQQIFSINEKVREKFPSISVGVAIIKGVSVKKTDPNLEKDRQELLSSFKDLTTEQIGDFPEIVSYRRLYREMGIDWHSRRPSPEALLRRVTSKKGLYNINTCVDAYNLVVIKHRVSVGAFDLDKIKFPTILRFPELSEKIFLLGDVEETMYASRELAYFDQVGGFNIDFNYRDAQRTAVQTTTKNIYINVDGIFDIAPYRVEKILRETCDIIIKYCGGKVEVFGVETAS